MAKKKVSRQDKIQNTAMDEKVESLKALNAMLLKETFERRQQVESLQLSNGSLQSQLTDQSTMLDLHTNLVSLYVSVQMTQFMEVIHKEKDEMKAQFEAQVEEAKGLERKLAEIQKEGLELNVQIKGLLEENEEKERKIEVMTRDKNSMDKCLTESNWAVERMKKEIEEIVKEREAIKAERNVELGNKNELEKRVSALNEFVMNVQNEENKLRENVAVLEKRFVESVELRKIKVMEINMLVEEKRERENNFKRSMEEKGMVMKDFHEAIEQLDEHKKMLKKMSQTNYEIEQAKQRGETEINELQKQAENLRASVISLEECGRGRIEKIRHLESEISHSSDEFYRVTNERDEARKGLEEGKLEAINLRATILELEKKIEASGTLLGVMKDEKHNLIGEKKDLESRYAVLKKDISLMEIELAKTRKDSDHTKAKGELVNANSELVLNLLKNTAKWINASKEEMDTIVEEKGGEAIEPFVVELEAIKKGFKSRDTIVEEMKGEVKLLESSVAEAHKKKSFWVMVSSSATILAAAIAYARGH